MPDASARSCSSATARIAVPRRRSLEQQADQRRARRRRRRSSRSPWAGATSGRCRSRAGSRNRRTASGPPSKITRYEVAQQQRQSDRHDDQRDVPVRRRRSGRHKPRSSAAPNTPPATTPTTAATSSGPGPCPRRREQGHQRPERHELAVGEVGEAGGAEDEREADAATANDRPNLIPPTARFSSSSKSDGPDGPASPNGNSTNLSPSDWTATLGSVARSASASLKPFGIVFLSSVT